MIVTAFVTVLLTLIGSITALLPQVTLASIPLFGEFVRNAFILAITYWNSIREMIPYLDVVWTLFLYGYIPIEIGLMLFKLILGSRTPVTHN